MTGPATEVQHPDGSLDAERVTGAEAMQLLYALTADVARRTGTRVLAIKGATLSHHGLRAPRVSADIDVLMHPDDVDTFVAGMEAAGWRQTPEMTGPKMMRFHSVNLLNDHWPMGIDAHVYFPGFLAASDEVFEELWRRRVPIVQAGREVWATDLASSASIAALHHLRAPWQPTNMAALDALTGLAAPQLTGEAGQDLLDCARATGSVLTLTPFLERLGLTPPAPTHPAEAEQIDDWRLATTSDPRMAWVYRFRSLRPHQWPGFLWHALMLNDDELRAYHGDQTTTTPLWLLRVRRWRRIVEALPAMVRRELTRRRTR
ncbi:nucleotidyltransferase family protein [Nocardioides daphniae]|uniref:Nucleotidyltransferase family protein n=1 Tax=Nocardioides daphniae TaxID=402297 RepID=A0ABQ1Q7S2_9ACTN|nr:nucleotidyltransferase family protein [Nocardioides daphniae]GGD15081.1 hypothetical protein GCM10007231_12550 [Nocardioides daphniae]